MTGTIRSVHNILTNKPIMIRPQIIVTTLLALAVLTSRLADAFHPAIRRSKVIGRIHPTCILQASNSKAEAASADDIEAADKRGMTTLKFVGSASTSTDPVPRGNSNNKSLASFFAIDKHRDLLMKGSGNVVELMDAETEVTSDLMDRWAKEAERVGATAPKLGDPMLRVTTAGIQFPGLKVLSVATIGAKLVQSSDYNDTDIPAYEFTLVKDTIRAEGPRPIRFIFNKLTASRDGEQKEQTTHSLTRTTAVPAETGDGLIFKSSSYLEVDVQFPSFLLRILPVSKEKAEEQGSASILKTIEKDSGPALENFKKAYLDYIG